MCKVRREGDVLWIEDDRQRVFGVHVVKDTGKVMFTQPSGKPGVVRRISELSREATRTLARELLALVGEHDQ